MPYSVKFSSLNSFIFERLKVFASEQNSGKINEEFILWFSFHISNQFNLGKRDLIYFIGIYYVYNIQFTQSSIYYQLTESFTVHRIFQILFFHKPHNTFLKLKSQFNILR
jgi:hypothetical protein